MVWWKITFNRRTLSRLVDIRFLHYRELCSLTVSSQTIWYLYTAVYFCQLCGLSHLHPLPRRRLQFYQPRTGECCWKHSLLKTYCTSQDTDATDEDGLKGSVRGHTGQMKYFLLQENVRWAVLGCLKDKLWPCWAQVNFIAFHNL